MEIHSRANVSIKPQIFARYFKYTFGRIVTICYIVMTAPLALITHARKLKLAASINNIYVSLS